MTPKQGNNYQQWALTAIILIALSTFFLAHAREKIIRNGFDLSNSLIDPEEILSGGVPRDGIPAITKPQFIKAKEQTFLSDSDRIIGVQINGTAKAYPIRILNWHEIVNDSIGDTPISSPIVHYAEAAWYFYYQKLKSNSISAYPDYSTTVMYYFMTCKPNHSGPSFLVRQSLASFAERSSP